MGWQPIGKNGHEIHDNRAGEIEAITEKAVPVSADLVLIEDSAGSHEKKKAQIGNLGAASGGVGSWTSFTPTWTAATTNPTIGNGELTGAYQVRGDTVLFMGRIVMGSTTTFGSGIWSLSLPVAADLTLTAGGQVRPGGIGFASDGGSLQVVLIDSRAQTDTLSWVAHAGAGFVGPTIPFTWASGDVLTWNYEYPTSLP